MKHSTDLKLQARLARRTARRLSQMLRYNRLTLQDMPILFANSFPKSGTHLLTQVLQGFTRLGPFVDSGLPALVTFEGETGRPRATGEILQDLNRLLPGDIAYGHLHATQEVADVLCQEKFIPFFILRDPRDVVVSHVHYVTDMAPNHAHHNYYVEELHNFDERLRVSIVGRPDTAMPFLDIRARFEPYTGWFDHPQVFVLHYEDFITKPEKTTGCVLDHAIQRGFSPGFDREHAIRQLAKGINPQRSPTFRSGKIGDWRRQFSQANKQLFKEVAGDLLIRLGYEQNYDW